jgi:hypothetical protein
MNTTTIEQFAATHRLKTQTDREDSTMIIAGKNGASHVFEYADGVLGFMLMPSRKSNQWNFLRSKLVAPSFRITQDGEIEGVATFDHDDAEAVELVLKVCRIHARRQIGAKAVEHLRRIGFGHTQGGDFSG